MVLAIAPDPAPPGDGPAPDSGRLPLTPSSTAVQHFGAATMRTNPAAFRHPLEKRTTWVVATVGIALSLTMLSLLLWGADLLASVPVVGAYVLEAKVLLVAVFTAPLVTTYARRRRRMLVQAESIRVSAAQLPEVYAKLVSHAERAGIPVPELYVSDVIDHTTTFTWQEHTCIVLCTKEFTDDSEAFDDALDFSLAREVGAICLGYAAAGHELLASFVAPIPFLRAPLLHMRTYSCDRYGAFLAPCALRALLGQASGERLRSRVNPDAYFRQLDRAAQPGRLRSLLLLIRAEIPLAYRVRELRRAGLLTTDGSRPPVTPPLDRPGDPAQRPPDPFLT